MASPSLLAAFGVAALYQYDAVEDFETFGGYFETSLAGA
jgi:hypothetical protein